MSAKENTAINQLFERLECRYALRVLWALRDGHPQTFACCRTVWVASPPHLALNEFYCMCVVKYAGIEIPEFYLSDDNKLFIMKRFDIKENGTYLGFEDMCVLQARQAHEKYEGSYSSYGLALKSPMTIVLLHLKQFFCLFNICYQTLYGVYSIRCRIISSVFQMNGC